MNSTDCLVGCVFWPGNAGVMYFFAENITKLKNCITFMCTGFVSEYERLNFRMNSQGLELRSYCAAPGKAAISFIIGGKKFECPENQRI
jgi:hypothetical protein